VLPRLSFALAKRAVIQFPIQNRFPIVPLGELEDEPVLAHEEVVFSCRLPFVATPALKRQYLLWAYARNPCEGIYESSHPLGGFVQVKVVLCLHEFIHVFQVFRAGVAHFVSLDDPHLIIQLDSQQGEMFDLYDLRLLSVDWASHRVLHERDQSRLDAFGSLSGVSEHSNVIGISYETQASLRQFLVQFIQIEHRRKPG